MTNVNFLWLVALAVAARAHVGATRGTDVRAGVTVVHVKTGDFTLDGVPDIYYCHTYEGSARALGASASGTTLFAAERVLDAFDAHGATMLRFDSDACPDLVFGSTATVWKWYKGDCAGNFVANTGGNFALGYAYYMDTADFNGDGLHDLAVAHLTNYGASVYLNPNWNTRVVIPHTDTGVGGVYVHAADFTNDSWPDVVVASTNKVRTCLSIVGS